MKAALKKQLKKAYDLMDKAQEIICEVKNEMRGVNHDDDFYVLEDVEYRLNEVQTSVENEYLK